MDGIFQGISNKEYHQLTDLVSHGYLSKLNKCPAAARIGIPKPGAVVYRPPEDDEDDAPDEPESAVFTFGRALHCLLLEGKEAFYQEFIVPDDLINLRTIEGKATVKALKAGGLTVIMKEDFIVMQRMVRAVYSHPTAAKIIKDGIPEQSVFWTDPETSLPCKCRPDLIPAGDKGVIVDIKTARDAGYDAFTSAVNRFGYYRQGSFYLDGYNAASGKLADAFVFIVCEKEPPWRVEVYALDNDYIESIGRRENRRLMQIEKVCRDSGYWPHFVTTDIREIYPPGWLK
jgi:hypothetical protein